MSQEVSESSPKNVLVRRANPQPRSTIQRSGTFTSSHWSQKSNDDSYISRVSYLNSEIYQEPEQDSWPRYQTDIDELYMSDNESVLSDLRGGTELRIVCEVCQNLDDLVVLPGPIFNQKEVRSEGQVLYYEHYSITSCHHVFHTTCLNVWRAKFNFCPSCECKMDN